MGNTTLVLRLIVSTGDHPHIHGEYSCSKWANQYQRGSPPHTWGIQPGLLPTHQKTGDHPHIHGEYTEKDLAIYNHEGSPPHTWGILKRGQIPYGGKRITPTYMGNTRPDFITNDISQDHPHIHGEYYPHCGL